MGKSWNGRSATMKRRSVASARRALPSMPRSSSATTPTMPRPLSGPWSSLSARSSTWPPSTTWFPFPARRSTGGSNRKARLRNDPWWLDGDFRFGNVAFHPRAMSAEELAQRCYRARCDFYRLGSILHRAWDFKSNCRDLRGPRCAISPQSVFRPRDAEAAGVAVGQGI